MKDVACYVFKEGYLRTSCFNYELNSKSLKNRFVHLTNNAVQKNCETYGNYEEGNQMSYKDFDNYL